MNCVTYDMCRKFKNLKISYIFEKKKSVLSIFCSKNANEVEKVFKEK